MTRRFSARFTNDGFNFQTAKRSQHRHCERSEAIHSWRHRQRKMDCLRRFAPRNDVKTHLRILAANSARVLLSTPGPPIRGRSATPRGSRECRAPAAARGVVGSTRVSHHGHAGSPGIPRAMVLTAYFALSPVTGLSCHRRLADTSATLDASVGASGPHDFAVRKPALSSEAPPASTASRTLRP
jgi:hypothetical protein